MFGRDVRYAARILARNPGFTAVAVLSLALGIGANTAIFSVLDAMMLRALPVDHPDALVAFERTVPGRGSTIAWPYPAFELFRDLDVFDGVAASAGTGRSNLRINGSDATDTGEVAIGLVSGTYFPTMGVRAAAGRLLGPGDDRGPGTGTVAVISYGFWRRQFAGAPDALGRTFTLNQATFTIVGIGPPDFSGEDVGDPIDVWLPVTMQPAVMTDRPGLLENASSNWIAVIARVKRGVSPDVVRKAIQATADRTNAGGPYANVRLDVVPAGRGFSRGREFLEQPLALLMAVAGLVLIIACANVAMLLMARAAGRRREIAIRVAIGAGRGRIVRQLLTESLMVAAIAGAIGLALGAAGTNALVSLVASGRLGLRYDVHLDLRMLAVTSVLSLVTGVLFGVAPSLRATRVAIVPALTGSSEHAPESASGAAGGFRAGKVLVVAQVALSLVLMIGAGLLVRTLRNLETQDLGFDRAHVWLFWLSPGEAGRQGATLAPLFVDAEARVAAVRGVIASSLSTDGLLSGFVGLRAVAAEGHVAQPDEDLNAQWNLVGPRFFETIGIRRLAGRDFSVADTGTSPRVAIVNEAMARAFFGDGTPIGRHFGFGRDLTQQIEIVGVVQNSKYFSARDADVRMVYLPYRQDIPHLFRMCVAVRTAAADTGVVTRVREALRAIDPAVPVRQITSTDQQFESSLSEERLTAWIAGLFSVLAAALACIGLYGVMSYTVARRTRELGIRTALGASRDRLLGRVLGESLRVVVIGTAVGVPLTLAGARGLGSLLFGVRPTDPVTMAVAVAVLVVVAALAGLVPAWRASRVDPVVALRSE